ncbi:phosphatase, partial [Actinoplanes sp. NPDC051633]
MTVRTRLLPLLGHTGGRDPMTCLYRCGNACDHPVPNDSDNPYLGDIVASRRGIFRAGALGAVVLGVGAGVA